MNNGQQFTMQVFSHIVPRPWIGRYLVEQEWNGLVEVSNIFGTLFLVFIHQICYHQERKQLQIYAIIFVHHVKISYVKKHILKSRFIQIRGRTILIKCVYEVRSTNLVCCLRKIPHMLLSLSNDYEQNFSIWYPLISNATGLFGILRSANSWFKFGLTEVNFCWPRIVDDWRFNILVYFSITESLFKAFIW